MLYYHSVAQKASLASSTRTLLGPSSRLQSSISAPPTMPTRVPPPLGTTLWRQPRKITHRATPRFGTLSVCRLFSTVSAFSLPGAPRNEYYVANNNRRFNSTHNNNNNRDNNRDNNIPQHHLRRHQQGPLANEELIRHLRRTFGSADVQVRLSSNEGSVLLPLTDAIQQSVQQHMHLMGVALDQSPPVIRLVKSVSQAMQQKKRKTNTHKTKEFRLVAGVAAADRDRKLARAREAVRDGHSCILTLRIHQRRSPMTLTEWVETVMPALGKDYTIMGAMPRIQPTDFQVQLRIGAVTKGRKHKNAGNDAER